MADEPAVRSGFVRSEDGVQLYWRTVGEGPVVACCNGVGVSTFFWKYLAQDLSAAHQVLLWDYRGHGRSDPIRDPERADLSVARHARDLALVLEAVAPGQPAVVVGHSMGCQVALEMALSRPEKVAGLILALGTAGQVLHTFNNFPPSALILPKVRDLALGMGNIVNDLVRPWLVSPLAWKVTQGLALVDPIYTLQSDMEPYMRHLAGMDLRVFLQAVVAADVHDAWPRLGEIQAPTLVIGAEKDTFTPLHCARRMAQRLPRAELLVLADASHAALIEQPHSISARVLRFLQEGPGREGWGRAAAPAPAGPGRPAAGPAPGSAGRAPGARTG